MKYNIALLIVVAIILSSCEKTDVEHDLTGEWISVASGGGITGQGDNQHIEMFLDKKSRYQVLCYFTGQIVVYDTTIEQGIYKLSGNKFDSFREFGDFVIEFQDESTVGHGCHMTSGSLLIQLFSYDTLCLVQPYADGFGWIFVRQSE